MLHYNNNNNNNHVKSCSMALLLETVETHWATCGWLTVFLFDGNKTCPTRPILGCIITQSVHYSRPVVQH